MGGDQSSYQPNRRRHVFGQITEIDPPNALLETLSSSYRRT